MTPWRLLRTGPAPAAWNMALDEALLLRWQEGDAPVLRLYGWRPAAISLGRFQPGDELEPPPGTELVRRITGGAAILHGEDELTYSVVAPYGLFPGRGPRAAYAAIHQVLARALGRLGVPLGDELPPDSGQARPHGWCYAQPTPYDLHARGRKLVGSAQRRRGKAFLQHGSLPRSPQPDGGSISLDELLPTPPGREELEQAVSQALGELWPWRPDTPRPDELALAETLAERYRDPAWTRSGGANPL